MMEELRPRDKQAIQDLYNNVLPVLAKSVHENLVPVIPLFEDFVLERLLDTWTRIPGSDTSEEVSVENGNIYQLGLKLRLEGFNKPGAEPFDINKSLLFRLELYNYTVGPDPNNSWLEKAYLQRWDASEYEDVAAKWSEAIIDTITERLSK